jgi:hypothetical protein
MWRHNSPDGSQAPSRLTSAAVWAVAVLVTFGGFAFYNDHFDRISSARQLAMFGELPFRDFFDPGYIGALIASVALQRVFGDNLLGGTLLNTAFIATGTVLVLHLATRLSVSLLVGLTAASLALTMPRSYDFPARVHLGAPPGVRRLVPGRSRVSNGAPSTC